MICQSCGANIEENQKFCQNCGREILSFDNNPNIQTTYSYQDAVAENKNNKKAVIIIAVVAVILAIGVYFGYQHLFANKTPVTFNNAENNDSDIDYNNTKNNQNTPIGQKRIGNSKVGYIDVPMGWGEADSYSSENYHTLNNYDQDIKESLYITAYTKFADNAKEHADLMEDYLKGEDDFSEISVITTKVKGYEAYLVTYYADDYRKLWIHNYIFLIDNVLYEVEISTVDKAGNNMIETFDTKK